MTDWPSGDREAVYIPPAVAVDAVGLDELRARLAGARVCQGLSAGEECLSQIMRKGYASEPQRAGIYTESEQQDIYGDKHRVDAARTVLADAEDVLGGLQVCWHNGRRGIRVLLTDKLDHYQQLLGAVIEPERLVVEQVSLTETELARRGKAVRAQSDQLAADGIFLTRSGNGRDGFVIEYLAADFARADQVLQNRFGDFATIRYRGASHHTFRAVPFGSWLADEDRLHVFYALPHNGEQPGACQAFETETAVVVALTIKDCRGAKTLIGGFSASHATAQLREPLGNRHVIDDAHNRARQHWTQA